MSRPKLSVPSQWAADGGCRLLTRSVLTGSERIRTGAKAAAKTVRPSMTPAIHTVAGPRSRKPAPRGRGSSIAAARGWSIIAHTRIEHGVRHVGEQVYRD